MYTTSLIKDVAFNVGDRVVTPDGRTFRYAKAHTAGVLSSFGACTRDKVLISVLAPAQSSAVLDGYAHGVVGSRAVTITIASGDGHDADGVVAKNELRGGYIVLGNEGSSAQNRCIVGNTAVASGGGTCSVYLDGPLTTAITAASTYTELMLNPYSAMEIGGGSGLLEYQTFLGVPAVTATTGKYFWLQTWGPLWIVPGGSTSPGDSANDRTVYFVGDGSINGGAHITDENGYQIAGVIMEQDASAAGGPPFVMLQVSP